MDINSSGMFATYGDNSFTGTIPAPIQGTQDGQDSAGKILRGIINKLAKQATGIEECIKQSLEMDGHAYTVHLVGTPVVLTRVDGTHCGYRLSISILPGLTNGDGKTDERVARHYGHPG